MRREPLYPRLVLPPVAWRFTPHRKALPFLHCSYGLMGQTKTLPPSSIYLLRRVFAGCRQSLLGVGSSRQYLCNPCVGAWPPTPQCPSSAIARFFPEDNGLTSDVTRLAHQGSPCKVTSTGLQFSGLQSFLYVQAPTLARPPGCTHR
jgi:hypothetical protein